MCVLVILSNLLFPDFINLIKLIKCRINTNNISTYLLQRLCLDHDLNLYYDHTFFYSISIQNDNKSAL